MQFKNINKTSFVAGVGSAVLLGAALVPGLVGAQTADETPAATAEASVDDGSAVDCGPRFGGDIGVRVSDELAAALGVSVEDLQAAADSVRETYADVERPTTTEEREALQTEIQAAFAAALGISVDDLEAAKATVQADLQADAIARVNEKVADGTLTQEEADAIIERIESGEGAFLGGGRGGRGFGGFDGSEGPGRFGRFGGLGGGFAPGGAAATVTPDA